MHEQSSSQDEVSAASRRRRVVLTCLVASLLVFWAGIGAILARSRAAALEASFAWAEAQAEIASQTLQRAFGLVGTLHDLVRIRETLTRQGDLAGGSAIEAHLAAVAAEGQFGVVQVGVIGADGIMTWGSAPTARGTNLADRDHFRRHAVDGDRDLAISRPLIGRTTQRWSVQVTRPVEGPDGRFEGVAVVSLDPIELSATLQKQLDGAGRIVAVRRLEDGALLLRGRDPQATLGRDPAPEHAAIVAARTAPSGRIRYNSPRDGRSLLAGYQVPRGLPLVVIVAFDQVEELRGWEQQRNAMVAGGGAVTLALLALFASWTSRQRLRAEQLRLARERIAEAEAMARQRAEILAVMAHEIRTPLTGVLGFGELLAAADLPPEHRRHAEVVVETGRVLLSVVNDILDLAKIEAGRVSIETQPFELVEMLGQSLSLCQAQGGRKGLRLALDIAPDLPRWLLGDATRLRQIVGNFLSNAVKFTERGSVVLRARSAGRLRSGKVLLRLEVEDTGIGIPAEAQPRLFAMFEQAETGRRFGGTGLGLAICRRLVEAMGGSIGVVSEVGRGSTFWCEIPLGPAARPERPPAPPAADLGPALDVLVADDVATNRVLLRTYLSGAGHRVTLASDGVEAVAAAQAERFDVILMDVNMPGLDGLEATRRLRLGQGPNARTPIVALTASTSREERKRAEEAGMTLHLAKPVSRVALLQTLRQVVEPATG